MKVRLYIRTSDKGMSYGNTVEIMGNPKFVQDVLELLKEKYGEEIE